MNCSLFSLFSVLFVMAGWLKSLEEVLETVDRKTAESLNKGATTHHHKAQEDRDEALIRFLNDEQPPPTQHSPLKQQQQQQHRELHDRYTPPTEPSNLQAENKLYPQLFAIVTLSLTAQFAWANLVPEPGNSHPDHSIERT